MELFDPSFLLSSLLQHGAIRTTLSGPADYANDDDSGFQRIEAREIDTIGKVCFCFLSSLIQTLYLAICAGTDGIIKKIRETVGNKPAYLSIDVRRLFIYDCGLLEKYICFSTPSRSILSILLSHPLLEHLRQADGQRENCELF